MQRKASQIRRAAQLYYEQGLNQLQVSKAMGVSRTTVSRLLTDARESGVVTVVLHLPVELDSELSEQLRIALGLRDAVVVAEGHDDEDTRNLVAKAAADFVDSVVEPGDVIAISWGRTLARMVDAFGHRDVAGVEVVQMIGSLGEGDPKIDGPDLARRFAQCFGGTYRYINAPAVVKTATLCEELRQQPQIAATLARSERANIAVTSVGAINDPESSLERNGYLSAAERNAYASKGAVGHLLAKILDIDGNGFDQFNKRVLSIDFEALRSREWSICIGSSRNKGAALLGATRAGCANAVVTDSGAAKQILAQL